CPAVANADQADSDGDGTGNACDPCPGDARNDQDGDGICAGSGFHAPKTADHDNCPAVSNANQADTDGDGTGDACDPCPLDALNDVDHDGVCADKDNCPWVANADQTDSDGDGIGDACENAPGAPVFLERLAKFDAPS